MLFELIARRGLTVKMLNLGVEQGYRFKIGDRLDLHESVDIGHQFALNSIRNHINYLQFN